eukprot:gene12553-biopygen1803
MKRPALSDLPVIETHTRLRQLSELPISTPSPSYSPCRRTHKQATGCVVIRGVGNARFTAHDAVASPVAVLAARRGELRRWPPSPTMLLDEHTAGRARDGFCGFAGAAAAYQGRACRSPRGSDKISARRGSI